MKPLSNLYTGQPSGQALENCYPLQLIDPKRDGNCLPRTLSLAIYGTEKHHKRLRVRIIDYMDKNILPSESLPRSAEYMDKLRELRKNKIWMGTDQIEAFSYIVDCPVYCCVGRRRIDNVKEYFWQKLPYHTSRVQVNDSQGIYILNDEKHFFLVVNP